MKATASFAIPGIGHLLMSGTALSLVISVPATAQTNDATAPSPKPTPATPSPTAPSPSPAPSPAPSSQTAGLEDIVVTAQRRPQEISQVPISVQAIGEAQLARAGGRDTSALLALSPSVTYRQGASATASAFNIRGVDSTARSGGGIQPSTALVIDGVPVFRQSEFVSELFDISQIEVLRGPQGTLFGKNASAGVINVISRKPTDKLEGSVEIGGTNDEEWMARGLINLPLSDSVATRFTGAYRYQTPIIHNVGPGPDAGGAEVYAFSGKILANVTPDTDILLSASIARRQDSYGQYVVTKPIAGALGDLQRAISLTDLSYGNDKISTDSPAINVIKTASIILEANWHATDKLTVTSISGLRWLKTNSQLDVDATPTGLSFSGFSPNPLNYPINYINRGLIKPEDTKYFSQELRVNYEGERVNLVAGAFYQRVRTNATNTAPLIFDGSFIGKPAGQKFINETPVFYRIKDDTAAVFADITYKIFPKLSVFAGLRYTTEDLFLDYRRRNYNNVPIASLDPATLISSGPFTTTAFTATRTENNLSGRGGVQWRPTGGQNYYFSYNRGYKGPAADVGTTALATAAFTKPEIAEAWEIGTKQKMFDKRLSFSLALFDQTIKNIQQTAVIPGTIGNALINSGDLKTKGVEFEFQFAATSNLRLSGGLSYIDGSYRGGQYACNPYQLAGLQAGCTIDANHDGKNETQSLTGHQAVASPRWRYVLGAEYHRDLAFIPASAVFSVDWNWSSKTPYSVDLNPDIVEPSHGFLGASVTLTSQDKHWEFQIYGRNLTNEFYYSTVSGPTGSVGQTYGYLARDFKAYGGASLKFKF